MSTIRQQIQEALGEVYSGAGELEASALIDKLMDRNLVILYADDLADRIAEDYDFVDEQTAPLDPDDYRGIDEDREMP